jgi:hypothetical protein
LKYDLTFLSTEGWKKHKIQTDKTPSEIVDYINSIYTKEITVMPAKNQTAHDYLNLEDVICEHPRYPIPNDKALNYFKNTKQDYIDHECASIKKDFDAKKKKKKQMERFLDRLF